jgi:UrcA family protein
MSRFIMVGAFALAASAALPVGPALAQSYDDDYAPPSTYNDYDSSSIIVTAPHSYRVGRSEDGAPIELREASQAVSYSDLDLRTHAGRDELYSRVDAAARDACAALDDAYGIADPALTDPSDCRGDAVRRAQDQVDNAIDYANDYQY